VNRGQTLLAAWLLAAAANAGAQTAIETGNAWISEAPPGVGVAAAYLEIHNRGAAPATLTGAESVRFERVEMHESMIHDGMAAMHQLDGVEIPAGASVAFAPGGRHFMLFGKPPLPRAGEEVTLTLRFADGTAIELKAPVRRP